MKAINIVRQLVSRLSALGTLAPVETPPLLASGGKGIYTWRLTDLYGGDPGLIAKAAEELGLRHINIKIADATENYNVSVDLLAIVAELRSRRIEPWGWHYVYGVDPAGEASRAIARVNELGLRVYIIDAESQYKNKPTQARTFCTALRAGIDDSVMVGLSSYRLPSYHPTFPWDAFRAFVDFDIPQMYWQGSHNPGAQLERSYNEFQTRNPRLPYLATGSAYKAGDWYATPADIVQFMDKALELGLRAVDFWEWAHARRYIPGTLTAIGEYRWPTVDQTPPSDVLERLASLETWRNDMKTWVSSAEALHADHEARLARLEMASSTPSTPPAPPENTTTVTVAVKPSAEKAIGHIIGGYNNVPPERGGPYPIMMQPPITERHVWRISQRAGSREHGSTQKVHATPVKADGAYDFYKVYGLVDAQGRDLYLSESNVVVAAG